jgi:prepilin-type N-terminal cleavage/methylation domain-containing protein
MKKPILPPSFLVFTLFLAKKHRHQKYKYPCIHPPAQGLTLIETLVAMIVFAIGLLGMIKLLSVSSRLQNNMEYQLQANLISSNIREILSASGGRLNPAFIEGVLDAQQCNGTPLCLQGKKVRVGLNQQNQSLYGSADLTVRITHGTIVGNGLVPSTRCHDPIFAQVVFSTKQLQTTGVANQQSANRLVVYNHQVGQYRLFNNSPGFWGVSCTI